MSESLLNPSAASETAPHKFKAEFETTKGGFEVEVIRSWSPNGADRFYNLVRIGFFKDVAFFRVLDGFVAQFGIHGSPEVMTKWREARIPDDPVKETNARGTLVFASAGPNTRTTQLFINFGDNANLDGMGFSPFAKVVSGMHVVESLYDGYGEGAPRGRGPDQGRIQRQGNTYLRRFFPELDYVKSARISTDGLEREKIGEANVDDATELVASSMGAESGLLILELLEYAVASNSFWLRAKYSDKDVNSDVEWHTNYLLSEKLATLGFSYSTIKLEGDAELQRHFVGMPMMNLKIGW